MVMSLIVQTSAFLAVIGLLLFVPAGTLDWPQAWIFLAVVGTGSLVIGLWLRRFNPQLLAERMKPPVGAGQKPWDRALMISISCALLLWLVLIALDAKRFGWWPAPRWAQILGALLLIVMYAGVTWVFRANSFAIPLVRLQPERNQTVIASGPYAIVRHPMYAMAALFFIGTPLLLGSLCGLLGAVLIMPALGFRAMREEAMLMDGLAGYSAYAARVRYRLFPGIW